MSTNKQIWDKLSKSFGGDSFIRANEPIRLNWEVLEFASPTLGDAVGAWGVPLGGITQLHGLEGCGKTFLAMLVAKDTLDRFPDSEVVWIDAETSFNKKWAKKIGLDISRVIIIPHNNGVDIFRALCGKVTKGKKTHDGILDHVISEDLNIKLIVLDSIAQIIPPAEEGRDFNEMEMAALARFLPRAFRRLRPQLAEARVAMLCINQARQNMEYGGGLTYSGGKGLRFNLDIAIKLHASAAKDSTLFDSNGKKCGHKIIATVEKCRAGSNMYQAEFWLDFNKGIVKIGEEVAKLGKSYGIISMPNNKTWVYDGESVVGKENFFAKLDSNDELRNQILTKIKEAKELGGERIDLHLSEEGADHANDTSGNFIEN